LGKVLAQVDKEVDSDNESFGDQSHAQLAIVSAQEYLFATKNYSMKWQLLLDNQSSANIMCNKAFITNIQDAGCTMKLKSTGGSLLIDQNADFEGFNTEVWFSKKAMTKILLFVLVRA
jgi:hypothetical protein